MSAPSKQELYRNSFRAQFCGDQLGLACMALRDLADILEASNAPLQISAGYQEIIWGRGTEKLPLRLQLGNNIVEAFMAQGTFVSEFPQDSGEHNGAGDGIAKGDHRLSLSFELTARSVA